MTTIPEKIDAGLNVVKTVVKDDTAKTQLQVLLNDLQDSDDKKVTRINILENELAKLKIDLRKFDLQSKVIDVTDRAKIEDFLAGRAGTYEEKRAALSEQIKVALQQSHIPGKVKPNIRDSTVSEELEYWRNVGLPDDGTIRHGDMKALTIIPEFGANGTSETLWRAFEHPWLMAIRNRHITESDMKSVLYQKLKGSAAVLYLSIPGVVQMPFGEVMDRMRKEYVSDPLTAYNKIAGMSQKPNESVRDFSARMTLEGAGFMPQAPRELATLVVGSAAYVIPNPAKAEESETFPQRYAESQARLANAFLRGLRPDITARLTSDRYTDYEQVVEAARKAEWMKDSVSTGVFNVEVDVHAMNSVKNRTGGRFKPKFGQENKEFPKNDACFRCGKSGHWAAECRQPSKTFATSEQAYVQRARPTQQYYQPPRGKFSARGRGRFRGNNRTVPNRGKVSSLPWNPRDPRRRKWMVQKRAGLNRKMKYRHRVHNLTGQEIENSFTTEEIELAELEEELERYPDEYELYQVEVEEFQDALDGDDQDEEPKN